MDIFAPGGAGGGEEEVESGLGNMLPGVHDMIVLQYIAGPGGGKKGMGRYVGGKKGQRPRIYERHFGKLSVIYNVEQAGNECESGIKFHQFMIIPH